MEARVFVFTLSTPTLLPEAPQLPNRGTWCYSLVYLTIKVQCLEEVSQVYSRYCQGALIAHPKTRSPGMQLNPRFFSCEEQ